ncbi:MAG TPA: hypothetical protein VH249_14060 [Xanthobacteraceae bacterium]|jgi:hypothetical protein|nr:hypothetical protein [Xanthobacteraceae bacterium]
MGGKSYWNDPTIAEQRTHELDRVLPTRRKVRKTKQESQRTDAGRRVAEPKAPKTGQGAEQSRVN